MTLNILKVFKDKLGHDETANLTDRERALVVLLDLCLQVDDTDVCRTVKQSLLKTSVSKDGFALKLLLGNGNERSGEQRS